VIKISISGEGAQSVATELKELFQDREAKGELVVSVRKERTKKETAREIEASLVEPVNYLPPTGA
jgi:hypothetical protein